MIRMIIKFWEKGISIYTYHIKYFYDYESAEKYFIHSSDLALIYIFLRIRRIKSCQFFDLISEEKLDMNIY